MRDQQEHSVPGRQEWRGVAYVALGVVILLAVLGFLAALLPNAHEVPESIWIRGDGVGDEGLRVGAPDGPDLPNPRIISSWVDLDGPITGVSLAHTLTTVGNVKLELARVGLLPGYRTYGAGYAATGRAVEYAGDTWREFVLFNSRFSSWEYGSWFR